MLNRRFRFVIVAALVAGLAAVTPGCDWLQGSDSDSRQSPYLSSLNVSPASVLCGQTFSVSFHYEDEQGDISAATVTLQRSGDSTFREELPAWPENQSRTSGTVTFGGFSFSCGTLGGLWSVKVQLEDERGHTSNVLSGDIRLNAPG